MCKALCRLLCLSPLVFGCVSAAALSDPTQPGAYRAPVVQQALVLESILVGAQRKVAVINGRMLRVGDTVHGARVTAIDPARVTLQRGAQRIVLELAVAEIKKRVR